VLYPGIRLPRNGSLKISDFDTLPHLFQSLGQFLHQVHLDVEIDGKLVEMSADPFPGVRRVSAQLKPFRHLYFSVNSASESLLIACFVV
jgi:hypothetical protein